MLQDKTIATALPHVLKTINLPYLGEKQQGKVRDIYLMDGKRILITTDRQSAFDVILGYIPYKGVVLNLLSQFWFEQVKDIIPTHMLGVPDPNVMVTKNCEPILVEMVVRGYLTGVTTTSVWYSYERGERLIYGIKFPDGLQKNDALWEPLITPTTHGGGKGGHDERLTEEIILERGLVGNNLYQQMKTSALALFTRGTKICAQAGLILVDTKYEFGLYHGELTLIDEIHTPDSSRFWIEKTYAHLHAQGLEPENYDKEFLRLWYTKRGYRGDGPPPLMSEELIVQTAKRYISVYEMLTGRKFTGFRYPIEAQIKKNISNFYKSY